MTKLTLPLQYNGYSLAEPASAFSVSTKGGFSRTEADLDDASLAVTVRWLLSEAQYTALLAFFSDTTNEGTLPFTIDLIVDNGDLVEYEGHFSSAGPQLDSVVGLNYYVTDTLEVVPPAIDEEFDIGLIALYEAAGSDPGYLDLLSILVNELWLA